MRRPPPISRFLQYPATAGTALLAIGLTLAWWGNVNMSAVVDSALITRGQVWRLLTSTLLHINMLHLVFNVWALWIFGTYIEERWGTLKLLAIMLFVGLGSSAAEFAVLQGGVGLSGINYGLFGLLWVLSRRDSRFEDAMDRTTIHVLITWFFICIGTTVLGLMEVANIAHGVGALLGALLGWTITRTRAQRKWAVAASGGALAVLMALAIVGRPWVNMWPRAGEEECYWGDQALQSERNAEAARWFADATRLKPKNATYWYGLGIARHRLKDYAGASVAYGRAAEIEPGNANYASTAQTMKTYVNETRSATTRPPS